MKKYIFISLLAVLSFCFTGCREEAERKFHAKTLDLTIMQKDWQFDDAAMRYYYHFSVPELTEYVYNYGNFAICREYNVGTKDAYQVALPESIYQTDTLTDGSVAYYTQHIDYAAGIHWVEITLTNSDYFYPSQKPETMFFRLQIMY